jgi:hypothetical protein
MAEAAKKIDPTVPECGEDIPMFAEEVRLPLSNARAAGYYTTAASAIPFEAVPIKVGRHPVPTILIARLAVDVNFRKQRLGELLLLDALRNALTVSSIATRPASSQPLPSMLHSLP